MNNIKTFMEYLESNHKGEENAVKSYSLETEFQISGKTLRSYVNILRKGGVPICSGEKGYYYAARPNELRHTINHLKARAHSINSAIDGLEEALN